MYRTKRRTDFSFSSIISPDVPLKVLVTPTTFIQGQIYVSDKTPYGFVVKGVNGVLDGKFDWLVIARRKGYEGADATPAISNSQFPISNEFLNTNDQTTDTEITNTASLSAELTTSDGETTSDVTEPTPEPTPESTPEPAPEPSESPTPEPTPESTPEPTPAPSET